MGGLSEVISPEMLPDDTLGGKLKLVALGIFVTVITQSSSAGVAAALTALYAGAINFHQAAALVIGMDIGTTVTAVLATIGSSVAARRTGYSHVIYNLFAGSGALILITPYVLVWEAVAPGQLIANAEIALVAFHTTFNTLGVTIMLLFTHRFAHMMERLVPGKLPVYTQNLDRALLTQPALALSTSIPTIHAEFLALVGHVNAILAAEKGAQRVDLAELQSALDETHDYVDRIQVTEAEGADWERMIAIVHTLDHMQRLHERCEEDEDRAFTAREARQLAGDCRLLTSTNNEIINSIEANRWSEAASRAESTFIQINQHVEPYREEVMARVATNTIDVHTATNHLQAIRWLRRVSKHIARISRHLGQAVLASGK
jgi:phosphate:Na+ symporter